MKTDLSKLLDSLGSHPDVFVCSTSYEARSRSVAERLDPECVGIVAVLENVNFIKAVEGNAKLLLNRFGTKAKLIELNSEDPLSVADTLRSHLLPIIESSRSMCLIDVTTLTHEELLILMRMLPVWSPQRRVVLAYTGADQYSVNTEPNDKWLSRGVAETRSVLGYAGIMLPSRKLHLIVLVGFEHERAQSLIQRYEPALISLGLGQKEESISLGHHLSNAEFHEKVKNFAESISETISSVQRFEFSCIDPIRTKEAILSTAQRSPGYNVAVCPMNTKPSTIGAALAGFANESLQLVYVQPIEYNLDGYSTPGETCTIFDFTGYQRAIQFPAPVSGV